MKLVVVIGILVTLSVTVGTMAQNWLALGNRPQVQLPVSFLNQDYLLNYLFWVSLVVSVALLVLLVVVLTIPRPLRLYRTQHPDGQLRITKKAIENFVLSALQREVFLDHPRVTVRLSRNRIRIAITGEWRSSPNVAQQAKAFTADLEKKLKVQLGIESDKRVVIRLVDFKKNERERTVQVI